MKATILKVVDSAANGQRESSYYAVEQQRPELQSINSQPQSDLLSVDKDVQADSTDSSRPGFKRLKTLSKLEGDKEA